MKNYRNKISIIDKLVFTALMSASLFVLISFDNPTFAASADKTTSQKAAEKAGNFLQFKDYQTSGSNSASPNTNTTGGATAVSDGNGLTYKSSASKNLSEVSTFKDVLYIAINYIDKAMFMIVGLAIVSMVYGVYKHFIVKGESPDDRSEGGKFVLYGLFAIFIMLSFWGLVSILVNSFVLPE